MNRLLTWTYVLCTAATLLLAGCNNERGASTPQQAKYAAVQVSIDFGASPSAALGTTTDVASVTIDVRNGLNTLISAQPLTLINGVWTGTLAELPVGVSLTFTGHAYNGADTEIFAGTTAQPLTGVDDAITLNLAAIDDGVPTILPQISQIVRPAAVLVSGSAQVYATLGGQSDETLTFALTPAAGGGSFTPESGSITLVGTSATLVLDYQAPAETGTWRHSLKVTNLQGNSVEVDFEITVSPSVSSSLSTKFAPVVTSLMGKRSTVVTSELLLTAAVQDDGPSSELRYAWSFDGELALQNPGANPATLTGYTQDASGVVTLSVTDENGTGQTTTITYTLPAYQFPDNALLSAFPPGTLDPGFGNGGVVTTAGANANAVAIQSDGKIVAAGPSMSGGTSQFALVRYQPNGAPDTTFGAAGTQVVDVGGGGLNAIALQSDGKILAAGYANGEGNEDFILIRCNADGSLDTSFGMAGQVLTDMGFGNDGIEAIALQSDGKIITAGYTWNGSDYDIALARYHPDGSLDPTFGVAGLALQISSGHDTAKAIAIQNDGKIVIAGASGPTDSYSTQFVVLRLNSDGSRDNSFGSYGVVTTEVLPGNSSSAESLVIQDDGKIIVAGNVAGYAAVARYNRDGSLDITFGASGVTTTKVSGYSTSVTSVALQSDGKIVMAGCASFYFSDMALIRYNANGTLDGTFGQYGYLTTFSGGYAWANALAIQPDGKLVVAGGFWNGLNYDIAIARYFP